MAPVQTEWARLADDVPHDGIGFAQVSECSLNLDVGSRHVGSEYTPFLLSSSAQVEEACMEIGKFLKGAVAVMMLGTALIATAQQKPQVSSARLYIMDCGTIVS